MSAMEEAIQEFTSECDEMLERISLSLTKLEEDEIDQETISGIYRDMHTIKGSSQLFGFNQIGSVAHAIKDLVLIPYDKASFHRIQLDRHHLPGYVSLAS